MITLSKLIDRPVLGDTAGRCAFCGEQTERGHKLVLKEKFMMYNALCHGDCVCEWCFGLYNDQTFRNRSWVATPGRVEFLKRESIKHVLLAPPEPPFALYVTKAGKRQGWIHIMNRVSLSREKFFVGSDFSNDAILFDVEQGKQMFDVAEKLLSAGATKLELLSKNNVMSLGKLYKVYEQHYDLFMKAKGYVGRQDWELIIFAL